MMILDNITSNSTVVYLSYKVLLASFWFLIGLNSYLYVLPKSIINKINRLSILELFLMLFALFMISAVIKSLAYGYFPPLYQDFSTYTWLGEVKSTPCSTPELPTPSNPSSSNTDNVSNGAIMAAAITGAYQIAKRVPTVTGKVATVAAGIGVGAAGIVAKNISDNISANVGKKNFIINIFINNKNLISVANKYHQKNIFSLYQIFLQNKFKKNIFKMVFSMKLFL